MTQEAEAKQPGENSPQADPEQASTGASESRAKVDRLRRGVVGLGALGVLAVLIFIVIPRSAPRRVDSAPERLRIEVPRLSAEELERMRPRWQQPEPPDELTEILHRPRPRLGRPLTPPLAAGRPAAVPEVQRVPLGVELRRHPEAHTEAAATPHEVSLPAENLAGQAIAELRRLTNPPAGAERDPRQLQRAEETAVRVALAPPLSPYEIKQGTYIPALLAQAASSEIGGPLRAVVSDDVLDAASRSRVLIPRGTVVLGFQERQPLAGERRLLVTWQRLIFPDGRSFTLGEEPAAGLDGSLGLPGRVDHHWRQRIGTAALLSLVGAGFQVSQPQRGRDRGTPSTGEIAAGALGLELGRLSQETLRRLLDVPPTVRLQAGAPVYILVTRDLAFDRPWVPGS